VRPSCLDPEFRMKGGGEWKTWQGKEKTTKIVSRGKKVY